MSIHKEAHPLAGKLVYLNDKAKDAEGKSIKDVVYKIEDWWDRVAGKSWQVAEGNPAAIQYAVRAALNNIPLDDEVVYGKIGAFGYLFHVSWLNEESAVEDRGMDPSYRKGL